MDSKDDNTTKIHQMDMGKRRDEEPSLTESKEAREPLAQALLKELVALREALNSRAPEMERGTLRARQDTFELKYKEQEKTNSELKRQLDALQESFEKIADEILSLEALKKERDKLRLRGDELEVRSKELEKVNRELMEQLSALRRSLDTSSVDLLSLDTLKVERDALQLRHDELERSVEQLKGKIRSLQLTPEPVVDEPSSAKASFRIDVYARQGNGGYVGKIEDVFTKEKRSFETLDAEIITGFIGARLPRVEAKTEVSSTDTSVSVTARNEAEPASESAIKLTATATIGNVTVTREDLSEEEAKEFYERTEPVQESVSGTSSEVRLRLDETGRIVGDVISQRQLSNEEAKEFFARGRSESYYAIPHDGSPPREISREEYERIPSNAQAESVSQVLPPPLATTSKGMKMTAHTKSKKGPTQNVDQNEPFSVRIAFDEQALELEPGSTPYCSALLEAKSLGGGQRLTVGEYTGLIPSDRTISVGVTPHVLPQGHYRLSARVTMSSPKGEALPVRVVEENSFINVY